MLSDIENQAHEMADAILEAERTKVSFNSLEYLRHLCNEKEFTLDQANAIGVRARDIVKERRSEVHPHQAKG